MNEGLYVIVHFFYRNGSSNIHTYHQKRDMLYELFLSTTPFYSSSLVNKWSWKYPKCSINFLESCFYEK